MGTLEIERWSAAGEHGFVLRGTIDEEGGERLERLVSHLCARRPAAVEIDLGRVPCIGEYGIAAVLATKALCEGQGSEFYVVPPRQQKRSRERRARARPLGSQSGIS